LAKNIILIGILTMLGLGALGGSYYVNNAIDEEFDQTIKDQIVIKSSSEDSEEYDNWITSTDEDDPPLYKRYYFWNLTNSDQYLQGATPSLVEIGPYVYRQFDTKFDVSFNSDNSEVSYKTYTYYIFDDTLSDQESGMDLSPDDMIINVNPSYLGVIESAGGEMNLRINFAGQTVATILESLKGDFTSSILAQGPATVLENVLGELTTAFVDSILTQGSGTALKTIMDELTTTFVDDVLAQGSGKALNDIMDGLTTEFTISVASTAINSMIDAYISDFLPQVQAGAVPIVLEEIQAGVTEDLYAMVNGSTAANVIQQNLAAVAIATTNNTAWTSFFNGTTGSANGFLNDHGASIQGISENLYDINLNFSGVSVQRFLYDGVPALSIPGWVTDLEYGTGILGYLEAYEIAANISDVRLDLATLAALYGATVSQLDDVAIYLTDYIFQSIVPAATAAQYSVTPIELAESKFSSQWANATVDPAGFDINDDTFVPDGFEAGLPIPTNLSHAIVTQLFDETNILALTNDTGVQVWFSAALGNSGNQTALITTFSLSPIQLTMILTWFGTMWDNVVPTFLVDDYATYGVTEFNDLAYLQWGNSIITSGSALYEIDPASSTNYTEFWAWSDRIQKSSFSFNASFSKDLLNGSHGLINSTELGTFLTLIGSADFANISTTWGLNVTEAASLAGYINYLIAELVIKPLTPLGVVTQSDLGYLQWTSPALTGGFSIYDLEPTSSPNYPEWWAWVQHEAAGADQGVTFTVSETKNFLTGSFPLTNMTNAASFLSLVSGGNFTTINAIWGLDAAESAAMAAYLQYLIADFVIQELLTTYAPIGVSTINDLGYLQWINSIITSGSSLFDLSPINVPNHPEWWAWAEKITDSADDGVSFTFTEAKTLLDPLTGLTNGSNTMKFFPLVKDGTTENFTTIQTLWGLNQTEAAAMAAYLNFLIGEFVEPTLLLDYSVLGYGTPSDLGYLQWANSIITSGSSLYDLDPLLVSNYPEWWAWAENIPNSADGGVTFTIAEAKTLLDPLTGFTNSANTMNFFALVNDGTAENFTTIQTLWGLNTTEAAVMKAYLIYLSEEFVKPTFLSKYAHLGYNGPEDIGFLQFASPALTGSSLFELDPSLPGYPEPWAFHNRTFGKDYSMNVTNTKALLTGTFNLTDAVSIGTFLILSKDANSTDATTSATAITSINTLFESKLTKTDVTMITDWLDYIMKTFVDESLLQPVFDTGGGFITTRSVDEWLWFGIDPLLSLLVSVGETNVAESNLFYNHTNIEDAQIKEEGKSDSLYTGSDDINKVQNYVKYEENTTVDEIYDREIWTTQEDITGTDASQFQPGVNTDDNLLIYVNDLLRVVTLNFRENVEIESIEMLRFGLSADTLAVDPNYHQTIKGLANMSVAEGIPLFLSKPHFLDGDPDFLPGSVTGMSPDASAHDTYIDVEPLTGTTMNVKKRLQINLGVENYGYFTTNISENFIPLLWIEEASTITADLAQDFIDAMNDVQDTKDLANIGGMSIGTTFLLASVFLSLRRIRAGRKPKFESIVDTEIQDFVTPAEMPSPEVDLGEVLPDITARIETFDKIVHRYEKIDIDRLSQMLKMNRLDLEMWLIDLPDDYGFVIDRNEVSFNAENIDANIDELLDSFRKMEEDRIGKE
jgi:hypothetical protein